MLAGSDHRSAVVRHLGIIEEDLIRLAVVGLQESGRLNDLPISYTIRLLVLGCLVLDFVSVEDLTQAHSCLVTLRWDAAGVVGAWVYFWQKAHSPATDRVDLLVGLLAPSSAALYAG